MRCVTPETSLTVGYFQYEMNCVPELKLLRNRDQRNRSGKQLYNLPVCVYVLTWPYACLDLAFLCWRQNSLFTKLLSTSLISFQAWQIGYVQTHSHINDRQQTRSTRNLLLFPALYDAYSSYICL